MKEREGSGTLEKQNCPSNKEEDVIFGGFHSLNIQAVLLQIMDAQEVIKINLTGNQPNYCNLKNEKKLYHLVHANVR